MNIFLIAASFIWLAIALGTLAAIALTLWLARKQTWKRRGMFIVICCVPLAAYIGLMTWVFAPVQGDLNTPEALNSAYRQEFDVSPTADVTSIQCRQVAAIDSEAAWFRIQASPETIDSLLTRFKSSDRETFETVSKQSETPSWWQPETDEMTHFYLNESWNHSAGHSEAVLAHDKDKKTVYFTHSDLY